MLFRTGECQFPEAYLVDMSCHHWGGPSSGSTSAGGAKDLL